MEEIREEHPSDAPDRDQRLRRPAGRRLQPGDDARRPTRRRSTTRRRSATFADTAADMVTAITMTYAEEAIGITRAAVESGLPVGDLVHRSRRMDGFRAAKRSATRSSRSTSATDAAPAYYMINCAHPTHFEDVLEPGAPWLDRIARPPRERLHARAMPSSTRRPSSTTAIRPSSASCHAALRLSAAARERARRLLWHRRPPRHLDLHGLARRR